MAKKIPQKDSKKDDKEKIDLLRGIIGAVAGAGATKIVDLLYGKQNVNEFNIAKELNLTINQARNILYKLSDEGIVGFTRKKDKKSGGWYTYFWTLNTGKALLTLKNKLLRDIQNLEAQLNSKRTKQFYYCPNCDIEMNEENALLYDFTCPECGEVFQLKENSEVIQHLEGEAFRAKAVLEKVDAEIDKIDKKGDALNIRRMKAEEKKKKAEREAKRIERKRIRDKDKKPKEPKAKKPKAEKKPGKKKPAKSKGAKKVAKKAGKKR
jgi:transcription initiation factor TFIIE subunit alpha